jgi:membrane protease YdiL (CAAX protease family)
MRLPVEVSNVFVDSSGRLRSGWRATLFVVAFLVCAKLFQVGASTVISLAGRERAAALSHSGWSFLIGAMVLLSSATLIGWACSRVFEELPFSSLGWSPHAGWFKNLLIGSAIGAGSLLLAAGFTAVTRGIKFSFAAADGTAIARTAIASAIIFIVAASGEEALFRGYPLQTFTRAKIAWVGVLLTSLPFAMAHLYNPHATRAFTFVNTAMAGIWLAAAYLRTRSLWFPLGLHWSWNWTQASLLGLPVSGIERIAPAPLLHAMNAGPDWLTGGAYGIEGGAACTAALVVSTIIVWRTKFVSRADVPEPARGTI